MSRSARNRHVKDSNSGEQNMLAKVQAEMAERYVEVEGDGVSLARLACIYLAGAREAKLRTIHGLRSLFRLRPAH